MPTDKLIFGALSRALKTSFFNRDGGAETQAGKTLDDFRPDGLQLFTYWENIIALLMAFEGPDQAEAESILIGKFKPQFIEGNKKAAFAAIKEIIKRHGKVNDNLRQQITDILSGQFPIDKDDKFQLQVLLDSSLPNDSKGLLQLKVIVPPFEGRRSAAGYEDLAAEKAAALARELVEKENFEWLEHLEELQTGEQRQTFVFAKQLGTIVQDKIKIIKKVIAAFANVPFPEQNESFISGFVAGVNEEEFTRFVIDEILKVEAIQYHASRLNRFLKVTVNDLNKLIPIINAKPEFIVGLQYLKYDGLTNDELVEFFTWMSNHSSNGNWLAIDLLERLIDGDGSRLDPLKELISSILIKKALIKAKPLHQLSFYQYELLVNRLIDRGIDEETVKFFTGEIRDSCSDFVMSGELHLRKILFNLFDKYWEISWPIMGSALLDTTLEGWYGIKGLLSQYQNYTNHDFKKWIESNLPNAPLFSLMILNFESIGEKGAATWNPIVKSIIDDYGSDPRVLQELSARLHSYSVSGSAIPIFTQRMNLVGELFEHPNEQVGLFALKEMEYFEGLIKQEKIFWQNIDLGEY